MNGRARHSSNAAEQMRLDVMRDLVGLGEAQLRVDLEVCFGVQGEPAAID